MTTRSPGAAWKTMRSTSEVPPRGGDALAVNALVNGNQITGLGQIGRGLDGQEGGADRSFVEIRSFFGDMNLSGHGLGLRIARHLSRVRAEFRSRRAKNVRDAIGAFHGGYL